MRANSIVRRPQFVVIFSLASPHFVRVRSFACQTKLFSTKSRPCLPFLVVPKTSQSSARSFTSERKSWLKHEAKLVARYTLTLWGLAACVLVISTAKEVTRTDPPLYPMSDLRDQTNKQEQKHPNKSALSTIVVFSSLVGPWCLNIMHQP